MSDLLRLATTGAEATTATTTSSATTPAGTPPAVKQSARTNAYSSAPDLTGNWRLVLHRPEGDDVYTTELVQLDQSRCPTPDRCYRGNPANGWWHYDHYETNNIVITPTLSADTTAVIFTATEVATDGTHHYNGTAPNDTTILLSFSGDMHTDTPGKPPQHTRFTFTRTT
ncbi:hypothetical protein ACFQ1S_22125 [Kibdelosporangium lantanae]|uniref:Lipocalin-like domain-containing protein n=1 Tax=Kibdelosporangium lantanae TaxID=1497396 RepID=A0ABW3MCK6_9PSEU